MANRQTRALRAKGFSLHFNKHLDFSGARPHRDSNAEIEIVEMPRQRTGKGSPVNSSKEREKRGKQPYNAKTMRTHPFSGLDRDGIAKLAVLA